MKIDVLMYHGFTDKEKHPGIENHHGKHLFIQKFEDQIVFLKNNYNVISVKELKEFFAEGRKFEKPSVLITFDDGYRSNFRLAFPVLQRHQVPAVVFVTTDFIDKKMPLWFDRIEYALERSTRKVLEFDFDGKAHQFDLRSLYDRIQTEHKIKDMIKSTSGQKDQILLQIEKALGESLDINHCPDIFAPLSWDEIRMMKTSGLLTIGSHTCSHAILTRCPQEDIKKELVESRKRIEEEIQAPCVDFSYPNGEKDDFSNTTHYLLSKCGYRLAFVSIVGSNDQLSNRYELKRLNIHNAGDLHGFKRTLSGFFRSLRLVKKWKLY
ncbi:MAG: polysaccharide deacetylase family protein [Candidatus Omnitrophica bacterium]|nr:polysaccharide deacetylase family protein [Candidatus Omnitrophota bacterium]